MNSVIFSEAFKLHFPYLDERDYICEDQALIVEFNRLNRRIGEVEKEQAKVILSMLRDRGIERRGNSGTFYT